MHIPRPRIPYFLIFYSTTFTLLALLLTALLLITPGDHIYQAFKAGELIRIIIVGGVYILTFAIAVFIYAARLFSTRSALAHIPRELNLGGDLKSNGSLGIGLPRRMGRLVRDAWDRSAVIAYQSTPRDLKNGDQISDIPGQRTEETQYSPDGRGHVSYETMAEPAWGAIRHPGWTGPESADLPDTHFESVITELPNLIEAKAISLVQTIPPRENAEEALDPETLELLSRPRYMGLGEYIAHLDSHQMIGPGQDTVREFVLLYDTARFSGRPLDEEQFRKLMTMFSSILRDMRPYYIYGAEDSRSGTASEASSRPSVDSIAYRGVPPAGGVTKRTGSRLGDVTPDSTMSRSDAQATAYTAPSRARFSRNLSGSSTSMGSTSGSVVRHVPGSPSGSGGSADSGASASRDSLDTTDASVRRGMSKETPLDIPMIYDDRP